MLGEARRGGKPTENTQGLTPKPIESLIKRKFMTTPRHIGKLTEKDWLLKRENNRESTEMLYTEEKLGGEMRCRIVMSVKF